MSRIAYTIAILAASFGWGVWCGEDLTEFMGISLAGLATALALVAISTLPPRTALGRAMMAAGALTASFAGLTLGSATSASAFSECVNRGEVVRRELAKYKDQKGHYPDNLTELGVNLPGNRLLRGNILEYQKTDSGYDIRFQDWLITHVADENSGFFAQK